MCVCAWHALRSRRQEEEEGSCEASLGSGPPLDPGGPRQTDWGSGLRFVCGPALPSEPALPHPRRQREVCRKRGLKQV